MEIKIGKNDKEERKRHWGDLGEPAIIRLTQFCSSRSLSKADEELSNSFESVFLDDDKIPNASRQDYLTDLNALKQLLPHLYELHTQLMFDADQQNVEPAVKADPTNRLYASVKRNPE